jgi:hypothetical protein
MREMLMNIDHRQNGTKDADTRTVKTIHRVSLAIYIIAFVILIRLIVFFSGREGIVFTLIGIPITCSAMTGILAQTQVIIES